MFFLLSALCFLILAVVYFFRFGYRFPKRNGLLVFSGFLAIVMLVVTAIGSTEQIHDIENIKMFVEIEEINKEKADSLTTEFANYLAINYPQHENDIYNKIAPDKVDLYLVKYPEIKASETMMALVSRINQLQSDVFDQQIKVSEARRNIRYRLRNPFYLYYCFPTK